MRIALAHYHLKPGGVTQVLLNQARTLVEAGDEVLVLSGEAPAGPEPWAGIRIALIPELNYDRFRAAAPGNAGNGGGESKLARLMDRAVSSCWKGGADIVHVHNPLIQKNSSLLGALRELGAAGQPLLLQNHDLAEDFRPDVYSREPYPENCHYAVINSRDFAFLREAGLGAGLYLLPNEVRSAGASGSSAPPSRTRYLYPVRGIRRKNLGEALLLSLFIPHGKSVAVTQPPTTEKDAAVYNHWKKTAGELSLPVEFEAGRDKPFAEVLESACCALTTSVKEGFGFSFLEPWTAGLAVTGRRIDYVCKDFEDSGVRFNALYSALTIPREYANVPVFKEKLRAALQGVYAAFGIGFPPSLEEKIEVLSSAAAGIDFGAMDEELQEGLIRSIAADRTIREAVTAANPYLEELASWPAGIVTETEIIEENRRRIAAAYSREAIGGMLRNMYQAAQNPVVQSISRPKLLELYLDPFRVFLTGIAHG